MSIDIIDILIYFPFERGITLFVDRAPLSFMPTPVAILRCCTPAKCLVNERLVVRDTEDVGSLAH
jgi:hypothetical protein